MRSTIKIMAISIFSFISLVAVLIVLILKFGGAYEPAIDIRIHNQTDESLEIFIDDEVSIGLVTPGNEVVWDTGGIFSEYAITARDLDGNTAYTLTWTRDDMNGQETYDVYLPPPEK